MRERTHSWAGRSAAATVMLLVAGLVVFGCARSSGVAEHDDSGHGGAHAHETTGERGPHGGRLFEDEDIQLELAIEEDGIPPEFRAYLYGADHRPISPVEGRLSVVLERFAGRHDSLTFRAEGERFRSDRPVAEPHSFAARVFFERGGRRHTWTFEQHEGRVELPPQAIASADLRVAQAGPREIEVRVEAPGEVRLNGERVVQVRPRFPGAVQGLQKQLGDPVGPGELIAVVHSNESLADYELRAPMAGTIVSREAAVGQSVDAGTVLYTIADLSTVWVDVALYPAIAAQVHRGQMVRIRAAAGEAFEASGTIGYVGPLLEQDTRVSYGRVVLPNSSGRWKPGLFVTALITVDRARVPVAVPETAIVRMSRGPGVFMAHGDAFELQPVVTGRSDGNWTEVVEGLEPGARIVVHNVYLLKAELGKSQATHDH